MTLVNDIDAKVVGLRREAEILGVALHLEVHLVGEFTDTPLEANA